MHYKGENLHCEDRQAVEELPVMVVQLLSLEILKTQQENILSSLMGSCN